jgi:hypothetical protein
MPDHCRLAVPLRVPVLVSVLVLAGLLALLGGCAGVPAAGAPIAVRSLGAGDPGTDVPPNEVPSLPQRGDTPVETVQNFLDASRQPAASYAAAKNFLRSDARSSWPPEDTVVRVIEKSAEQPVQVNPRTVRLTSTVVGGLSLTTGIYVPSRQPSLFDFTVESVDGVPLITNPPPFVLLDSFYFSSVYRSHDVYFPRADGTGLVADRRWAPQGDQATQVVRWLVGGPSPWLAPTVRTVIPSGTRVQGVVVRDGLNRTVDLSSEVEGTSLEDRKALAAQFALSLEPDLLGGSVRLTVNGKPYPVLNSDLQDPDRWASQIAGRDPQDQRPYYVDPVGDVRRLALPDAPGESAGEASGDTPALAHQAVSAAISVGRKSLAVVGAHPDGSRELRIGPASGSTSVRLTGTAIGRPSWALDGSGVLVPVAGRLTWVPADRGADTAAVQLPDLDGAASVIAVRAAPDGVRLALVAKLGSATRVYVGVLTAAGGQLTVVGLRNLLGTITNAVDVGWTRQTELTVLIGGTGVTVPINRVTVDGLLLGRQEVDVAGAAAAALAVVPNRIELAELGGTLVRPGSSGWLSPSGGREVRGGQVPGHAPFYPG